MNLVSLMRNDQVQSLPDKNMIIEHAELEPRFDNVRIRIFEIPIRPDIFENARHISEQYQEIGDILLTKQVHGTTVVLRSGDSSVVEADAQATKHDSTLGVITGDCVPVLLFSEDGTFRASVHAGHQGLSGGIIGKAIESFADIAAVKQDLHAFIGPHIGNCCYNIVESNDGRIEKFRKKYGKYIVEERDGGAFLDLGFAAKEELVRAGIAESRITINEQCTYCSDNNLPSHYRSTYRDNEKRKTTLVTIIQRNA